MINFINDEILDDSGTHGAFLATEWESHMKARGEIGLLRYETYPEGDSVGHYTTFPAQASVVTHDIFAVNEAFPLYNCSSSMRLSSILAYVEAV